VARENRARFRFSESRSERSLRSHSSCLTLPRGYRVPEESAGESEERNEGKGKGKARMEEGE
jgi:hypothetical protein